MTDHGKAYGENPPTAFPKALEIERTDFHISSVPTTAANLTQFKTRKEPFPVRLTFAPFRLILRLEKTPRTRLVVRVILGRIDVVVVAVASCVEGFEVLQSADMHLDTR